MGNTSEPDWYADPTGIHQHRFWDGAQWTAQVADRFGVTSAHHLQEQYPPPGHEVAPPTVEEEVAPPPVEELLPPPPAEEPAPVEMVNQFIDDTPKPKRTRMFSRRKRADARFSAATAPPADLGETTEAEMHTDDPASSEDALMVAASVLQQATEEVGFSWRDSDMTIDEAINALPIDIADDTVNLMNRLFATAGDDENAAWTAAKLREIKGLKRGYRKLHELVTSTPQDELFERSRSFGVPDDLTHDFVEGVLSSEIPTVAELQTARLPVGGPDAA